MDKEALFWKIMAGDLPSPNAATTLGIKFKAIDADAGTIEIEFDAKPEFTNPMGKVQGGFLAAMLDDTMGPLFQNGELVASATATAIVRRVAGPQIFAK